MLAMIVVLLGGSAVIGLFGIHLSHIQDSH
jgi:hypothetical protein